MTGPGGAAAPPAAVGPEAPARGARLRAAWPLLALAVWLPLHFAPLFSATRLEDNGDISALFWPGHVFAAREMQAGRAPLWNPHAFGGTPFLAGMQGGVAYPPNWPARRWGGDPVEHGVAALNAARLLHLAWLAAGLAWLLRGEMGRSQAAAALGALAFVGSGYLAPHLAHLNQLQTLAWGPWIIGLARRLARGDRAGEAGEAQAEGARAAAGAALLLAGCMAMALLAGHPQNLYYVLGFCALLLPAWLRDGARALGRGLAGHAARRVPWFLAAGALALGLAAVQVVPSVAATRAAWTAAEGRAYAAHLALPPGGLLGYVAPWWFGSPAEPGSARFPDWAFHEFGLYFGLLPLLLALGAAAIQVITPKTDVITTIRGGAPRRPCSRLELLLLAAVWLLAALLALGEATPLWGLAYDHLPLFGSLRAHARTLLPGHFALVLLAAVAADALLRRAGPRAPLLTAALLAVTALDLALASRGADFRHMEPFVARLDSPISRALDADRAADPSPARLFWMIRDDHYFSRGAGAHDLRASQLTPNLHVVDRIDLTHGYGESLQPTLRWRDFLDAFHRNLFAAAPDLNLLAAMNVRWVLSDIDAPIDFGSPPIATMNRPGLPPLRLWRIAPLPRVFGEAEERRWSERLGGDVGSGLARLDGPAARGGAPLRGRNSDVVAWNRGLAPTPPAAPDDSPAGHVSVLPPPAPGIQPFDIVGAPVRRLTFLMGTFPGWRLVKFADATRDLARAAEVGDVAPVSAVAWQATPAPPDAAFPPGSYAFVYAPADVALGAQVSLASLLVALVAAALLLLGARRRTP